MTLDDLAEISDAGLTEHLACLSGCFYGYVVQGYVDGGPERAKHHLRMLQSWFPHLFVEVQHHNINHDGVKDTSIVTDLYAVADEMGLLTMATQDSHYIKQSDTPVHKMMKSLITQGPPDEAGFPGDSYHLATTAWVKKHYDSFKAGQKAWSASEEAASELLSLNKLKMPALDKYSYQVPTVGEGDPDEALRKLARAGLRKLTIPDSKRKKYGDRLAHELEVIKKLGMADYFLVVADYIGWARSKGILVNARGSANASLVCYSTGITSVDPIKWDLLFERFLALDRIKPPDIDLDVEDRRRDELVEYIKARYEVCQIGTFNTLGIDAEGKGSILVSWLGARRRQMGPEAFSKKYGFVKDMDALENIAPDDVKLLRRLARLKVRKAAGIHAAGLVISGSNRRIKSYLPTMFIPSSSVAVTQMTMDDVEDAGYVKLDILGLRSLTTLRRALEMVNSQRTARQVNKKTGAVRRGQPKLTTENMPMNDRQTFAMLRKGRPDNGIFQFEGYTQARGLRELGVKSVMHMAIVNALYRPATMYSGMQDEYLDRWRGKSFDYLHPIHEKHTKKTLGIIVFQEQVISIMRDIGVTVEDLNKILKAVKASNAKIAAAEKEIERQGKKFTALAEKAGMDEECIDYIWNAVEGFSDYGFNKAHAVGYAIIGYQMAYLKVHYPLEFMAAVLETTTGTPKEAKYLAEARYSGIRLLSADVNTSGPYWTLDVKKQAIRKGLTAIKGVGVNAAVAIHEGAPYNSVEDLIERTPSRVVTGGKDWVRKGTMNGILLKLKEAGALRSILS